jgi:5'-nucleotidase
MALGVPAIALSQALYLFHDEVKANFETAVTHAPGIIRRLLAAGWPQDVVINLNFPATPPEGVRGVEVTRQGFRDQFMRHVEKRTDLRGRDYYWMGFKTQPSEPGDGTDLRAVYDERISITPLHIDLTHDKTLSALKAAFDGPLAAPLPTGAPRE